MSYQALYRKYRPTDFSSVKGQEHIVTTLNNQIKADRIGHAYLFCGTRGTGKTTVAKIFAKAVNCENPGPNGPCGTCAMCRAIANQSSMNVVEIDAASNNRVDDIRQVIEEVQYSPAEGRYKVYIIDEVHMLTTSAFNALLKTLEEPPSYLIFILATTEAHKIPLTILSRCQRYDFKRISVEVIAGRLRELLEKEGIEAEEKALSYIARLADGALRDGLSLLEQCISFYFGEKLTYENVLKVLGAVDHSVYHELIEALVENHAGSIMEIIGEVVEQGKDLYQFVNEFIWYLRNLLVLKNVENVGTLIDVSAEDLEEMRQYAERTEQEMLFRYIRILSELANEMKYSSNKRVLLEIALIRLCRPQMQQDYDALVNRIHNLEETNEELQEKIASGQYAVSPAGAASTGAVPEPAAMPKKEIRPEAVPDDVRAVVGNWKQLLRQVNPVTRGMLEDVRLSVSDSGALILAFPHDTTASYFRKEENAGELIEAAGQMTGKEITLDVRFVENKREMQTLPELRNIIKNVEIEMID
jgi:DNA polymerase-3 subunit gamma/tau